MEKLEDVLKHISQINRESQRLAREKVDSLSKPLGSLGKLEDICVQLAGIYGKVDFDISKKAVVAFAGDHGVYEEGVAADPQWITKAQIPNFAAGICAVGTLAKYLNAQVVAVDVGINCDEKLEGVLDYKIRKGTSNMRKGPAMTRQEAIRSLEIGIEVAENTISEGNRVLAIGEMGIANTTPSSAIISVFAECDPAEVTGRGAGLSQDKVAHKVQVIRDAIALNKPNKEDGIDVLMKVGGFEIGAMAGAILGAAYHQIPVVLDGFISYAAALLAASLQPLCKEYMIASHYSAEPGSIKGLELLGLNAPLHLEMRLGEGSGGILAFQLLDAAHYLYEHMATREASHC